MCSSILVKPSDVFIGTVIAQMIGIAPFIMIAPGLIFWRANVNKSSILLFAGRGWSYCENTAPYFEIISATEIENIMPFL